jgi:hypothetical protein
LAHRTATLRAKRSGLGMPQKNTHCSGPHGTKREFIDFFEKKNNSSPHAAIVNAAWKQSRQELFSNLPVPCKVKMPHSPINSLPRQAIHRFQS